MGKCSCSWIENDNLGGFFPVECSEEIWEGSKTYCIFHDPSRDKDIRLFKKKLDKNISS